MSAYLTYIDLFSRFFLCNFCFFRRVPISSHHVETPGDKIKSGEFDSTVGDRTAGLVGWVDWIVAFHQRLVGSSG